MGHHQGHQHIYYGSPRRIREREKGAESIFGEIMTENDPTLMKNMNLQIQESQQILRKTKLKRPTLRHIKIKPSKVKDQERILKVLRGKQFINI